MFENFYTQADDMGGAALMSKRHRADGKTALALAVLAVGRNVAFGGKGGGGGSAADPQIGQAALMQAQTGDNWLKFAQDQFNVGNTRQDVTDALSNQVVKQQIASQDQANAWAQEDRNVSTAMRDKYTAWGDEDRATGEGVRDAMMSSVKSNTANAQKYQNQLDGLSADVGATAAQFQADGQKYGQAFDARATNQYDFADEQQGRYKNTFQPIENKLASDAMGWDSDARMASEAAKAKADVLGNAQQQRESNQRSMASMGVDPRSGRYAGVERATDLNTALAAAGAQNTARDTIRSQAQDLRNNAAGIGQRVIGNSNAAEGLGQQATQSAHSARATGTSMANQARQISGSLAEAGNNAYATGQTQNMQAYNLGLSATGAGNTSAQLGLGNQGAGYTGLSSGLSAGNAAMGSNGAANNNFYQNGAQMNAGFGGAMQGYAGQASTLNSQWSNQIAANNASNASAGGLMSGIGSIAGAGIMAY